MDDPLRSAGWLAVLCAALVLSAQAAQPSEAPAPTASQEISVSLSTADPRWVLGTEKQFTATVRNESAAPWLLDRFGDLNALYEGKRRTTLVPSCWILARLDGPALTVVRKGRYTLARDQFLKLQPGESWTQELTLRLSEAAPGEVAVHVAYMPRAGSASFSFPDHWEAQQQLQGKMWLGMAYSNSVTVRIVRPSAAAGAGT